MNKNLCTKCIEARPHPWHDNGEWAGELPTDAQPPVQLSTECPDSCTCNDNEPLLTNQSGWLRTEPAGDPRFHALLKQIGELHDKKQQDYGSNADAFANVRASEEWGVSPWIGAMIRATDKVRRLQSFSVKGTLANEGVEDSLMDLAVYALISLVLFREEQID